MTQGRPAAPSTLGSTQQCLRLRRANTHHERTVGVLLPGFPEASSGAPWFFFACICAPQEFVGGHDCRVWKITAQLHSSQTIAPGSFQFPSARRLHNLDPACSASLALRGGDGHGCVSLATP